MRKQLWIAALAVMLPAGTIVAKPGDAGGKPPDAPKLKLPDPPTGQASKAVTDEILDAVKQEMDRAMNDLQIDGAPKPYQISYKITEVDVNDASASLGQTTSKRNRHFVSLEARVRVGSPALDNANFVVPGADEFDAVATASLPLEATPRIARRAAWLVTDAAYKEALIQLRAKFESRRAGGAHIADVPAWIPDKPLVSKDPILVTPLETLDSLEDHAKAVSAVFRDQPVIRESHVAVTSYLERRWYITTEGTNVTDTRRASGVVIDASGQADDGTELDQYYLRYGHVLSDLPSDAELAKQAKTIVDQITALQKAPITERYSGPILFEGEGAVGLIRNTLAPNLGGTPVPEGLNPQEAKQFGGALADKVGLRAISPSLSIVDDPSLHVSAPGPKGVPLIGGYKIDDEGTPARRVEVVKDGVLKTLLTSRTPSKKDEKSNGHARRPADGGAFHGSATNLFVSAKGSVSRAALKQKLISAARAEGLKYGLLIRRFDDAAVTGAPEFTRRELVQMIKSTDQALPPPAILAYRVYPDGREELVRNVQLAEVPIRAWKDVLGTSTETTAYNFLASTDTQLQHRLEGGTADGFVPSGGIESGIITPDLLLKEIDVSPAAAGSHPPPAIPRPTK